MRDTNVTIDYRRKQRMREILTQQFITKENRCARYQRCNQLQEKTKNLGDTNVKIDYRRKQRTHEIPT